MENQRESAETSSLSGIKDIQAALTTLGYNPKYNQDGIDGPITQGAVRAFQEKNGLTITGKSNTETLRKITEELKKKDAVRSSVEDIVPTQVVHHLDKNMGGPSQSSNIQGSNDAYTKLGEGHPELEREGLKSLKGYDSYPIPDATMVDRNPELKAFYKLFYAFDVMLPETQQFFEKRCLNKDYLSQFDTPELLVIYSQIAKLRHIQGWQALGMKFEAIAGTNLLKMIPPPESTYTNRAKVGESITTWNDGIRLAELASQNNKYPEAAASAKYTLAQIEQTIKATKAKANMG